MSENDINISLSANEEEPDTSIAFVDEGGARLNIRLRKNGDVIVNDKLVSNSRELVDVMDRFAKMVAAQEAGASLGSAIPVIFDDGSEIAVSCTEGGGGGFPERLELRITEPSGEYECQWYTKEPQKTG